MLKCSWQGGYGFNPVWPSQSKLDVAEMSREKRGRGWPEWVGQKQRFPTPEEHNSIAIKCVMLVKRACQFPFYKTLRKTKWVLTAMNWFSTI